MSSSVHHEGHVTKATVHMLHVAAGSAVLRKAGCSTFSASCFSICLCVTSCREGCYTRNLFSFTMALRCKLRGKLLHVRKAKTLTTTTTTTTTKNKNNFFRYLNYMRFVYKMQSSTGQGNRAVFYFQLPLLTMTRDSFLQG